MNSHWIFVKTVRIAGAMWASPPTNTPEVPKKLVGADASVRPWEVSNSPEIFVKKQIFLRADRVVRPYEHYGSSVS